MASAVPARGGDEFGRIGSRGHGSHHDKRRPAVGSHDDAVLLRDLAASLGPPEPVPLDELVVGETPRWGNQDSRLLGVLVQVEGRFPPIIVHRPTMLVIDGLHRLAAMRQRGEKTIDVRFFDGSRSDAFVVAVRANTRHGKPLTLFERERSVARILASHPDWSDRLIAETCGLSAKRVAALRPSSTADGPQSNKRVGRDGRARPLNADEGRLRAAQLLRDHPRKTLREIARVAGVAPSTVLDVRDRLNAGASPLVRSPEVSVPVDPPHEPDEPPTPAPADAVGPEDPATGGAPPHPEPAAPALDGEPPRAEHGPRPEIVENLLDDRALQSTQMGKVLVDWLAARVISEEEYAEFVEEIPISRVYVVAECARAVASAWARFAERLEARSKRTPR